MFEVCILLRRKYHNFQKYVYPSLPPPHIFADANPLFALILEPTNHCIIMYNSYIIIVYGIIWYN